LKINTIRISAEEKALGVGDEMQPMQPIASYCNILQSLNNERLSSSSSVTNAIANLMENESLNEHKTEKHRIFEKWQP
jgi:hypothetical protein